MASTVVFNHKLVDSYIVAPPKCNFDCINNFIIEFLPVNQSIKSITFRLFIKFSLASPDQFSNSELLSQMSESVDQSVSQLFCWLLRWKTEKISMELNWIELQFIQNVIFESLSHLNLFHISRSSLIFHCSFSLTARNRNYSFQSWAISIDWIDLIRYY